MKEIILKKTADIFLKFGFKSVTMDDIANDLGMSKKTLYKYFKNKEDLVDQAIVNFHENCLKKINGVCAIGYNAIEENFEIKKIFKDLLQSSDESPMFQLKKYYPNTFNKVMNKEFEEFQNCIITNIKKGINEGLYIKSINKSVVSRFYFSLVHSVHDDQLFTYKKNSINQLEIDVLEYHTRAIATTKGIKELEKQLLKLNHI
ncbi:TetR/AcrR family transcriptional regulator [Lutibacter sp. TH_r2]|uniref:TetR/AcrR family transcriptional regulator n=1 Tax=Lutibacter sp. TH_r2 TaxID=3082083 RepID=UPI002952D4F6|nr:TetR/AcrR family transcriptional regulator [Lutibacter sp. TH_r2]MDV7186189.1 TetR/AcrR family transcriptional regulator [Lutibacter sp. TH_r2]